MSELHQQYAGGSPDKYEQDCINLLVRDPHWLYVYWDISENKRNLLVRELGSEFYDKSVPALKITNVSRNESFFVRINEFSTNWYVHVDDANSIYVAEIGRKISDNFFVSMLNSNRIVTPGDSVSENSAAYFINYNHLREGRLELGALKEYRGQVQNHWFAGYPGISSMEFAGNPEKESAIGLSSAHFYGV